MAYKDKIYDITALEMAKRLEVFLNEHFKKASDVSAITLGKKISKFTSEYDERLAYPMWRINNARKDIVHPKHLKPILNWEKFADLQKICFELEKSIRDKGLPITIREVLSMLPYDMGNAGDIIKHGVLAEFLEWRLVHDESAVVRKSRPKLRIADTFGGCPWDNIHKDEIKERIGKLSDTAFGRAQNHGNEDMYYGSTLLMRQVAKNCDAAVHIEVSDKDKDAFCNWTNTLRIYDSIKWINLPRDSEDFRQNDGYRILDDSEKPGQYDLILIDPYSEFLRDEFIKDEHEHFSRILSLTEKYPDLFVAVFVLDMNPNNSIGKSFAEFKKEKLADCAFSLRCPKLSAADGNIVKGESGFDSEILLINAKIGDDKYRKLYEQLQHFAQQSAKALPLPAGKPLKLWGAGQEGTPDNPQEFSHK